MKSTYRIAFLFSALTFAAFANAHAADTKAELLTKLASFKPTTDFAATAQITKTRTEIGLSPM